MKAAAMTHSPFDIRQSRTLRLAVLVLILLLGFTLRTHDLETRSLWEDEGWTMLLSAGPGLDDVARTLAADQHPPLFFVLFRVWRNAAGDSEFAGRFFSVLISLLAVTGMVQLGRSLFSPAAGLVAGLLIALADLPIDLAQEIRHYSLLTTLAVFSSLFYVRWWRSPTRSARIGYVLTSLALLYTHYLGGFVLFAQLAHMLLVVRPWARLREALFLFGAVCIGFLPWLPVVIDQNQVRWDNPLYYQNALPNSRATFTAVSDAVIGQNAVLIGGLALLGLILAAAHLRWRSLGSAFYLVLWIGLMTVITVGLNERRQFLTVRNFIIVVPPLLVLAGYGLASLPRATRSFMIVLILVVGLTTVDARRHYPDWRGVARTVTSYHQAGEPVVMDVWVGDFPLRYYIEHQMGAETPRVSLREWRDEYKTQFLPTVLDYLESIDTFWLVTWNDANLSEYGSLIDQAGFQRTLTLATDHLGSPIYSHRYDRLPTSEIAQFADLFTLRQVHAPTQAAPGDAVTLTLWWNVKQPVPLDYSVSVFALDSASALVAQHDSSPLDGRAPTSGWQPGAVYFDAHTLHLPADLPAGDYTLGVKVYWYGDGQALAVQPAESGDYARLGILTVQR